MRRVWSLQWTTAGCTVMRSCEKLLMTANSGKKRLMDSPEFSFKLLNKGSVLPSIHLWFTVTLYYRDSFSIFDSVYHVVRVKLFWLVNKCRRVQGSKPTNSHTDDVTKPNSQHTQKCARAYEVPLPQYSSPLVVSVTSLWRLLTHSTDLDVNPNSYTITLSWTVFSVGSCADGQTLHQQQHHRHPLSVCEVSGFH